MTLKSIIVGGLATTFVFFIIVLITIDVEGSFHRSPAGIAALILIGAAFWGYISTMHNMSRKP